MKLTIRALTPELWPALEELFGAGGGSNSCWCQYWRVGPGYRERRKENKAALQEVVKRGPPPGLLAFDGDVPVGWCGLTPRRALRWLDENPRLALDDGTEPWVLSCFYVRRSYRERGVMSALVAAAIRAAKRAKAPALEAYPVDTAAPGSTQNLFTGVASTLRREGFTTVGQGGYGRLIMRHDLRRLRSKAGES
jgi:GNAT superfamily N-acetyltransferase